MNYKNRILSYLRLQSANKKIQNAQKSKTELNFGPTSLNLMMTDTCNSQCIMCGKDYKICGTKDYLSMNDIETIYSHLDMNSVVDVIYGGGGEPFLNPDLAEIATYTARVQPSIQHTVISNFIQWRQPVVEALMDANVNFLISLNAASRDTYKTISGVAAFDSVTDHVKRLTSINSNRRDPVKISISMILMRQNINELPDFVRLASDLGVEDVKTLYVRVYPEKYRDKEGIETSIVTEDSLFYHQDLCSRQIEETERVAQELKIDFDHEPLFTQGKKCTRNCAEPWKSLFINFNGDVYPCPASEILFKPKVDGGIYKSGNIIDQHYKEFWNNEFWQTLRKTNVRHGRDEIIPECLCCGNAINWAGPQSKESHVLDWSLAENSKVAK